MGYLWVHVDGGMLTIGLNEEGLEEFSEINNVDLPTEGTVIAQDEVCGEIDTDQGPLNLYCPVEGEVIEINETVVNNPQIIIDDCLADGWLFKVEVPQGEPIDIASISSAAEDNEE
jgi:glycine cleavage system H protein